MVMPLPGHGRTPCRSATRILLGVLAATSVAAPSFAIAATPGSQNETPQQQEPTRPESAEPTQGDLQERLRIKLAKAPFARLAWHRELAAATEAARREREPILAYFTRSYARCPPCDSFEDRILAHDAFAQLEARAVLLLHVASQVLDEPDAVLPRQLGIKATPTLAVLDANGGRLHVFAYGDLIDRPERVVARIQQVLRALRDKADVEAEIQAQARTAGGSDIEAEARLERRLLLAELELGSLDLVAARQRVDAVRGGGAEELTHLRALLADLEVESLLGRASTIGRERLVKETVALLDAGSPPTDRLAPRMWFELLRYAHGARDVSLFRRGVADLRRRFAQDPGFAPSMSMYEEQLVELEKAKDECP